MAALHGQDTVIESLVAIGVNVILYLQFTKMKINVMAVLLCFFFFSVVMLAESV